MSLSVFTKVKPDRCAQYVDDIDVAAHTASELIKNFDYEFKQNGENGLQIVHRNKSI